MDVQYGGVKRRFGAAQNLGGRSPVRSDERMQRWKPRTEILWTPGKRRMNANAEAMESEGRLSAAC